MDANTFRIELIKEGVDVLKSCLGLVTGVAWPLAVFACIWITRHELRALIKRIVKFRIGHKETTADIELSRDLEAAKVVAFNQEQVQKVIASAESRGKASVTANLTVTNPAKALRDSMGRDLEILEQLAKAALTIPRAAIEQSWEILKRNVIATAKLFNLTPVEGGGSDLHQSVHYLTLYVLESQDVMIGVYSLATVLQKVEKNPDAEVAAKDAQDFVRSCMAIIADLSFEVDKKIGEQR